MTAETVIIGGGFAGSLLALKLAEAGQAVVLIDPAARSGPGLAYGAAQPIHLLNVPVGRMELGLTPGFAVWLSGHPAQTRDAAAEAGELSQAFVSRTLFGQYLADLTAAAIAGGKITRLRGEVTAIQDGDAYRLMLADGRHVDAARVVLACGNLAPKAPHVPSDDGVALSDRSAFIADPWAPGALDTIAAGSDVLLIGSGLTAVDIALALQARGHGGQIHLASRHGLVPHAHVFGGAWQPFLEPYAGRSPVQVLRVLRAEIMAAKRKDVPWQRVIDAARPSLAKIWSAWTVPQRAQFLRHGRAFWDIHRHRMAPRIAKALRDLYASGRLQVHAGRLVRQAAGEGGLDVTIRLRHSHDERVIHAAHVINCTGPRSDFAQLGTALFASLRQQGLIRPDALGLGIDTSDARVIDARGRVSDSLFTLGSLTRPAWWEITAVPEISAQVSRLADLLTRQTETPHDLTKEFFDIGAGI